MSHTLKLITVWLVTGTVVFLGIMYWQAQQQRSQFSVHDGVIELRRSPDGHFHWPGQVNGVAVEFLVDTGATRTALPQALAQAAGLQPEQAVQSSTAGGVVRGYTARAELQLDGGVKASRLSVTVLPQLSAPLLGMDVLSRLSFTQQDGVLRLQAPTP